MPESGQRQFHLLDLIDYVVKRKEMFVGIFILSFILSFGGVYFFIEEQYESAAVLIPRSEDGMSAVGSLLRSVKGVSMGLGAKAPKSETDLYTTIVYSRTMMEDVIRTFGLVTVYGLDSTRPDHMEKAVKRLRKEVFTHETDESAYVITARASTRERAAAMANMIVQRMNERIVDLNINRARQNREFLGRRVDEIRATLRVAEDSLRAYQERTGLLDAKSQIQGIIEAHTTLESELAARRIQQGILEQMYDTGSPQVRETRMQVDAYEKKLKEMRSRTDQGSPILALQSLPKTAVELVRRYREVEINSLLLEYIMPLHEQARIEEKKDSPILQIIDPAIEPAKKSYPPRTLFALAGAVSVTLLVFVILRLRLALEQTTDPKVHMLIADIKRWSWSAWKLRP
jgi:tyrosine-protein kinase Etk/Wzc